MFTWSEALGRALPTAEFLLERMGRLFGRLRGGLGYSVVMVGALPESLRFLSVRDPSDPKARSLLRRIDPAVTGDKLLSPFAQEVQKVGALYPPDAGPVTKVQSAQLVVGQQWSAVIAGQEDPATAAAKAVAGVQAELGQ